MDYLRSVFTKRVKVLAIIGAASAVCALILTLIGIHTAKSLDAENLASRWSDIKDCSEVSVFFNEKAGFEDFSIKQLCYKVDTVLDGDSITANENARRWIYAYAADGNVSVTSKRLTGSYRTIGVGGDYFLFHPLKLVNGSYFTETNVMHDYVLIDTDMAWQLFGSSNVSGQILEINGTPMVISGVYEREEGRINDLSGNNVPTMYMPLETLKNHGGAGYIYVFESLLPNPISDYAFNAVKDGISVDEANYEVVENTGRFNWVRLLKHVKDFGTRGMNLKGIIYPYYENIARGTEDYLTPLTVCACIMYLFPAILVLLLVRRMWKKRTFHFADIKNGLERLAEKRRAGRRVRKEKKNEKKH